MNPQIIQDSSVKSHSILPEHISEWEVALTIKTFFSGIFAK